MATRDLYEDRRRSEAFKNAADAAKRKLYPELYFSDDEYEIPACRVCNGVRVHTENCQLRNPDKKDKPEVDDLLKIAGDKEPVAKKPEIETLESPAKPTSDV